MHSMRESALVAVRTATNATQTESTALSRPHSSVNVVVTKNDRILSAMYAIASSFYRACLVADKLVEFTVVSNPCCRLSSHFDDTLFRVAYFYYC